MKKIRLNTIIVFSMILFLSAEVLGNGRLNDLMNKGNAAFQKENYEEALKNYTTILNEGYVSTALYYNIGNVYYRLGKLGLSILYYEKTLKLSPDNENAAYNLKIAKAHTKDKIKEVPELFIIKWWNSFLSILPSSSWAILVLAVYFVVLLFAAGWFFTKSSSVKQYTFFGGTAALGILLLSIIFLISAINHENSKKFGILLQPVTTAKASPDKGSSDAFVIHEGVKFQLEDELQGWSEIKLPDGKVGWIPKKSFGEI